MTNDQTVLAAVGVGLLYGVAALIGGRERRWWTIPASILLAAAAALTHAYITGVWRP